MSLANWSGAGDGNGNPVNAAYNYLELAGSGSVNWGSSCGASRTFLVGGAFYRQFIADIRGNSTLTNGGLISRVLPDQHPDLPNLFCTDVSVKPNVQMARQGTTATYQFLEIEAKYAPVDFFVLEDSQLPNDQTGLNSPDETLRMCSKQITPSSEMLQLGIGGFKWVSTGLPLLFSPAIPIGMLGLTITWLDIPAKPEDIYTCPTINNITSLLSNVNQFPFFPDSQGNGYPPGTCLFVTSEYKLASPMILTGVPHYDIKYHFIIKNQGAGLNATPSNPATEDDTSGHNYLLNTTMLPTPGFDLPTCGVNAGTRSGRRLLESGNFQLLFQVDIA